MKLRKVFLYFSVISISLLITLYIWTTYKKAVQEEAVEWVESHAGSATKEPSSLTKELPENLKFLEKLIDKEITSLDLSGNNDFDEEAYSPLVAPDDEDSENLPPKKRVAPITDISILEKFSKLESLSLYATEVDDISVLKKLNHLEHLNLSYTNIKDISDLKGLVNLKTLHLSNTAVSDISPLKNLVKLERLNLAFTDVSDITPLLNLKHLQYISLHSTLISPADETQLKKMFPAALIRSHLKYNPDDNYDFVNEFLNITAYRFKMNNNKGPKILFSYISELGIRNDPAYQSPIAFRSNTLLNYADRFSVNLDLENLSIGETINIFCKVFGLYYKIEKRAIIIYHPSALDKEEIPKDKLNIGSREIQIPKKEESLAFEHFKNIIPKVRFEDRDYDFAVDFIKRTSRDLSLVKNEGLNVIALYNSNKKINIKQDNISVKELIDLMCEQLNLKYKVIHNTVIIGPQKLIPQ